MRYAVIFSLLGLGLCALAAQHGGWAYLLLWPGASALVVAAGYAGAGAGVFGKRRDGGFAPWAIVLHLPYLLVTLAVWQLIRLTVNDGPPTGSRRASGSDGVPMRARFRRRCDASWTSRRNSGRRGACVSGGPTPATRRSTPTSPMTARSPRPSAKSRHSTATC